MFLFCLHAAAQPDSLRDASMFDSQGAEIRRAVKAMTHPELERRKARLRAIQQRGFATTTQWILEQDPVSALGTALRMALQIELHLPHRPVTVFIPVRQPPPPSLRLPGFTGGPSPPVPVELFMDWTFPRDPWERGAASGRVPDSSQVQRRNPSP